jgi:hypothetical protein
MRWLVIKTFLEFLWHPTCGRAQCVCIVMEPFVCIQGARYMKGYFRKAAQYKERANSLNMCEREVS